MLQALVRRVRDALVIKISAVRLQLDNDTCRIGPGVIVQGRVTDIVLGRHVTIMGPTVISSENGGGLEGGRLEVGSGTYIGEFNNIRCAGAAISIGRDCLISQHVTIVGTNHGLDETRTIRSQPWHGDGVVLGNDVWVGANVVLLPGSNIGDGAVVAAGSVVGGDVRPHWIVGGVPARRISQRSPRHVEESRNE